MPWAIRWRSASPAARFTTSRKRRRWWLVEPEALLGDKGYDADSFVDGLTARLIKVVIPPKANRNVKRDCDFALYCERNLVERCFCIIKHFRAIATSYEKTARNFLAGLHLVCALAWLK